MNVVIIIVVFAIIALLLRCNSMPTDKSDKEIFEEVLNDPRVNSKEIGEREGIKYFQFVENGKTGFRDLNGKMVIKPIYDHAEMFSEGFSTVSIGNKYGLIDENGKYVLPLLEMEYLGTVHNGVASFRANNKYGFMSIDGQERIKPQFEWVDEFSEGLCVVRNDKGKHGYIDLSGKVVLDYQFQYALKFENGKAKVEVNNRWGAIDKTGKFLVQPIHDYATGW